MEGQKAREEARRKMTELARPSENGGRAMLRCIGDADASGPRHGFSQAIVGLVAHFQRLEFEELGFGFFLRGLGLLDLTKKLGDRTLEIVASDRRRTGVGRIGEMGGVGDSGALLFVGDLAVALSAHWCKL